MNEKNFGFYTKLGVEPFKGLAEIGGFASYTDLELVYDKIKDANVVMEIGAGYGRCIDFLLKKEFKGKVMAIEQSPTLCAYLKERYSGYSNIELIEGDFMKLSLIRKADVALWMWSGLIDFAPEEQKNCLQKLHGLLNPKATVVIDIPRLGFKTYATHTDEQHLHLDSPYGTLDCYIPSEEDMQRYCRETGYADCSSLDYQTDTNKERTIYILEK